GDSLLFSIRGDSPGWVQAVRRPRFHCLDQSIVLLAQGEHWPCTNRSAAIFQKQPLPLWDDSDLTAAYRTCTSALYHWGYAGDVRALFLTSRIDIGKRKHKFLPGLIKKKGRDFWR